MSKSLIVTTVVASVSAFVAVRWIMHAEVGAEPAAAVSPSGDSPEQPSSQIERSENVIMVSPVTPRTNGPVENNSVDAPANGGATGTVPQAELSLEEEEQHFKWLRGSTDKGTLHEELKELLNELNTMCAKEVASRIADGEYEKLQLDESGAVPLRSLRRHLVEFLSNDEEGNPIRITLPEKKFPEAYRIKRQIAWLEDVMHER